MPATIGSVRSPDVVAETPSTNCMNVGRKVSAPEHREPDDEAEDAAHREHRAGEQPDRQNRFGRTGFHPDEDGERRGGRRRTGR